jgi:APA family basic amino acid/polyamine antiporter
VALVMQAVLSIALLLLGANFRQLFSLAIFAEWLFYMISTSTIFVFRRREPKAATFRAWGYPVVPALFVVSAAGLLVKTFWDNRPNSGYGLLVILAGIPVFLVFSFLRRRDSELQGS